MINISRTKIYLDGRPASHIYSLTIKMVVDQIYMTADLVILTEDGGVWKPGEPVLCFVDHITDRQVHLRQVAREVQIESKKVTYANFTGE